MSLRCRAAIPGFLASLMLTGPASAEETTPAVVWYRASEECPSGAEFLGKLAGAAPHLRLAEAGDHLDFVVTLLAANGTTLGRLERQTQSGIVAMRELRDVSCERVADALALSLELALGPAQAGAVPEPPRDAASPAPAVEAVPDGSPVTVPPTSAVSPPVVRAPPTSPPRARALAVSPRIVSPVRPPIAEVPPARVPPSGAEDWSVGLHGGVLRGVAPSALPRVSAFADVEHVLPALISNMSLRLALVAVLGSPATDVGPVTHWIAAGRGEICPWRLGVTRAWLRPCVDFELGVTGASDLRQSGEHASSAWAAPGLGLRGEVELLRKLNLEVGGDALLPLVRNEVSAGNQRLYHAEMTAFIGYYGVSIGPF